MSRVESSCPQAFMCREMGEASTAGHLNLSEEDPRHGLGQLALGLIRLVHELLERQAIRRMEGGALSEEEVERLGLALMKQSQQIDRLREALGLREDDLRLDLGPLGRLV